MRRQFIIKFWFILSIILLTGIAAGASYCLGSFYLKIVRDSSFHSNEKTTVRNSESVMAEKKETTIFLNPIPVYYLQAGVFSEYDSAKEASTPLGEMGFAPFITAQKPHKVWIGVYHKRSDAEAVKNRLKDKGISSFVGSLVINGGNLSLSSDNEAFIKDITPILEGYTSWLKENLALFQGYDLENINWEDFETQFHEVNEINKTLQDGGIEFNSNNELINEHFKQVEESFRKYNQHLDIFIKQRNSANYNALQVCLLEFIDRYTLLWKEIDNIDKT